MEFYNQNKALILTFLVCSLLLLVLYNIKLSNSSDNKREMLVDLEHWEQKDPEDEQEPEPEEAQEQEEEPPQPNLRTHQAFNQERQENSRNFQERLDEIFERNSAESTASGEENSNPSEGDFNLSENSPEETQERSDGNDKSEEISTETGNIRNSSISFSLVGRSAFHIPNPIYTCDNAGKIVVNITVNSEGTVTSTSINKASSTSSNKCLLENAEEYAAGAQFSELRGRDDQKGTITYYFQN